MSIGNSLGTVLITGGTGSLGSKLVDTIYSTTDCRIVVLSRDEQKQYQQRLKYQHNLDTRDLRIHYILGDVRDRYAIERVFTMFKPAVVIHTAAQKHVRVCDENPEQAVQTNVLGTVNVADVALQHNCIMCFVSTDKAVAPTTLYGMTKAIAERHITNVWQKYPKKFCGVRYGNVLNSAGSLIPLYMKLRKTEVNPVFTVTHSEMTRFFISFEQATDLIFSAVASCGFHLPHNSIEHFTKGPFLIPQLQSAKILDIAELFAETCEGSVDIAKPYPTEKLHEEMSEGYVSNDYLMSREEVRQMLVEKGLL